MAGLGTGGKGKEGQQELGVQGLTEFHCSVITGPAQSHQWPARGDSTAGGERFHVESAPGGTSG